VSHVCNYALLGVFQKGCVYAIYDQVCLDFIKYSVCVCDLRVILLGLELLRSPDSLLHR
jgi:hypothetical protein